MSKIWRCPECETVNQGDKCIVCGYDNSEFNPSVSESQKPLLNLEQTSKPKVVQDSLKTQEQCGMINSQTSKPNKVGKIIAIASIAVAALIICFFANSIIQKKESTNSPIPDLSLVSSNVVSEITNDTTVVSTSGESVKESISESSQNSEKMSCVPNLVGLSKADAIDAIEGAGLTYEIKIVRSESTEKGTVISQNIPKESKVPTEYKITLEIGAGKKIVVPTVFNQHISEAKSVLDSAGVKYDIEYSANNDTFKDFVFKQSTEYEQEIFEDEVVTLWVNSSGETSEKIPPYSGMTVDDYTAELKRLGLPYQVLMCPTEDILPGYVVSISGSSVGSYYNGIHAITVYEAFNPDDISETSVEEFIVIKGNKYSTKLSELDLSGIYLTNEDIKDLSKMTNLKSLKLGGYEDFAEGSNDLIESKCTPISDISVLSNLKNLTRLDLSWNEISDLTPLKKLTKLTYLNLSNNQIKDIAPLKELNNLNELNLNYNQIENINELGSLTKLTHLDIVYNQIKDIDPLKGLTNLTYLNLFFNQVSDISSLSYLVNLRELNLETNKITDLTPLSKPKKISTLNLNSNLISDLTPISDIKSLSVLKIDNNKINNIDALSSLSNLTDLSLYKNEIEDISALRTMTNLKSLDLSVNHVSDISSLQYLTSLTELKLYCNCICDINPLRYLDNMESLSLGNNQVVDISPLKELTKLTYIDLTSNPVSEEDIKELNEALPNCYVWWFI